MTWQVINKSSYMTQAKKKTEGYKMVQQTYIYIHGKIKVH